MEKFCSFCKKAFSYPALLHKTYPVTAVSVIAATILFAIHSFITAINDFAEKGFYMELFYCLCVAFVYFSVFALCIESIRPRWSIKVGVITYSLFGVLSVFMGLILSDISERSHKAFFNFLGDVKYRAGSTTIILYIAGLMAVAILLAVYFSYSHDVKMPFNTHVFTVYSRIFFASIIYGIIQMGVIFLVLIVQVLLYDDAFNYLITFLILINGLFYVPAVLYAMTHDNGPGNEHANRFMEIIVRYVSLVITLIGFAIIYIYMIKLIVTASVPSNSVFEILAALFVFSMGIAYMSTAFEEKGILQKFAYNCPMIFVPFIIMQCYTAFVRISQYGLTPKRYFGIAFILFEIVYIVYYVYVRKTEKEIAGRNILLIMCAFLIICIFLPGVSARGLSNIIAKYRLSSYLKKTSENVVIPDREYVRINAAYGFLKDEDFGGDRLIRYFPDLTEDTVAEMKAKTRDAAGKISKNEKTSDTSVPNIYGYFNTPLSELKESGSGKFIDISSYNFMTDVRITDNETVREDTRIDTTKLMIYERDYSFDKPLTIDGKDTVDLSDFCKKFAHLVAENEDGILTESEYNDRCRKLCVIDVNENVRILLTDANITIDKDQNPVDVSLEGIVLMNRM